jgi:hypothetical protein
MPFMLVFLLVFLGLVGLPALLIYGLGSAIKRQARKPVKKFFTQVPTPATFSFQVLEERVVRVIENVVGWTLDEEGRFILDNAKKDFGFLSQHLGVLWIGIFSTIKVFKEWHWPEFRQVKRMENGKEVVKYEVEARQGDVTEFFFQFPYSVRIENIELQGNIQATLNAVFTVFFLYPVRAVFLNKDPVDLFIAMVRSAVRAWMSEKDFNEIKQITVSSNKSADQIPEFWDMLENLNGITFDIKGNPDYATAVPRGLYGKLGIAIVRVELEQVEAVGPAAQALESERLAELLGQAEITKARRTGDALVESAQRRMRAADLDAIAQRTLNEQNAGYYASLPGGARMFVADRLSSKDSDITTWVEGKSDMDVTLPLPLAPAKPKKPAEEVGNNATSGTN